MTLEQLKALLESGEFHHATYRNIGTMWEGWHIYVKSAEGFRGFSHKGAFSKQNPDMEAAEKLIRNTGYSVGSYGRG